MTLEKKIGCINQFFTPKYSFVKEGYGNCKICTADEKNKECLGYYPITIMRIKYENKR